MKVDRRLFLAGCAGFPALAALRALPLPVLPAAALASGVGEVWGMTYFAGMAGQEAVIRRRPQGSPRRIAPLWHHEFA